MKSDRQKKILELVREREICTQAELTRYLQDAGFEVTQATVSRDIHELKLTKTAATDGNFKYTFTAAPDDLHMPRLHRVFKDGFVSADYAGNMVVIRTLTGMANAVCAAFDAMDFSEVYISLQQGTIDGQENPYDLIVANKLYEPQKYITETNHVLHNLTMIMSKVRYDSFPADLQAIIKRTIEEALKYGRVVADRRIESRKQIVLDYGCEINLMSPELRQAILDRIGPVEERIRRDVGNDLVDMYKRVTAQAEREVAEGK